jgi:hypothetical protein
MEPKELLWKQDVLNKKNMGDMCYKNVQKMTKSTTPP